MADVEVILPKMGESVAEATITSWLKNVGDSIEEDEPIVEIATDKVDSEVPSPVSGVLKKILFNEDDVVQVGAVFAIIESQSENGAKEESLNADTPIKEQLVVDENTIVEKSSVSNPITTPSSSSIDGKLSKFYSPLVKSIAKAEGVLEPELEKIVGTGLEGRVTKKDILSYIETRKEAPVPLQNKKVDQQIVVGNNHKTPTVPVGGQDEIVEMDRMRKLIADHMVMSKHVSPHVTSFVEADVTNIVRWREKHKKAFADREGEKLTFTPIFIEAVVKALRDFPMVNTMLKGNQIIVKKDINVGMATALPSGNLIVPVIHNADQYNIVGLAKKVNNLAQKARTNKLTPDDIQGGTYTVSNVGTFGNVMGTPIINQPQSAILALGAVRKKPAVIETEHGDTIGIRHMMFLSHSYDHRIVDGALGGSFVKRVGEYLEQFDSNREI